MVLFLTLLMETFAPEMEIGQKNYLHNDVVSPDVVVTPEVIIFIMIIWSWNPTLSYRAGKWVALYTV